MFFIYFVFLYFHLFCFLVFSSILFSCVFTTLGVYENLQYGCDIDCNDVEKAINLVCEETSPVELDITPFLHSICGHLHNQVKMGLATDGPDILHLGKQSKYWGFVQTAKK